MSRAARTWSWFAALAVAGGTLAAGSAAWAGYASVGQAEGTDVVVSDNQFSPSTFTARVGESVWFQLAADAQNDHHLAFDERPGVAIVEYNPGEPKHQRNYFAHSMAGRYAYYCLFHGGPGGQGMSGVLTVVEPAPTTTSTARPTPTTTARPAPTTTTTKAAAKTAAPSTSQPAGTGALKGPTTTTKPAAAVPSPAAESTATGASAPADDSVPEVDAAAVDAEEAAFRTASEEDNPDGSATTMLILAVGLIVALLGGAGGWGWYHRSSRYHSA